MKKARKLQHHATVKIRVILAGFFMTLLTIFIIFALLQVSLFNPVVKLYVQGADPETVRTILARRGQILDRNGNILAESVDAHSLWVNPRALKDPEMFASLVGPIIEIPEQQIIDLIHANSERFFVYVRRKITTSQMQDILQFRRPRNFDFGFEPDQRREYPKNRSAASLIGCVGTDNSGLSGLEFTFNEELNGIPGKQIVYQTFAGDRVPYSSDLIQKPMPGYSLLTTIDYTLQNIVEGILEKHIHRWNAVGGVAVVMDPGTGEILCMASRPTFDLNQGARFIENPNYFNKAVSMNFEPGSVFKTIIAASALEEGVLSPMTMLNCTGSVRIADARVQCMIPHGEQNLADILRNSCNVGFVEIGMKMRERMHRYAMRFNLGSALPIRIFGQERGIVPTPEKWHETTYATFSFGQGLTATPLQIITSYAALANDGKMMKPMIIRELRDHLGHPVEIFEPTLMRSIVSSQTAREIKLALRNSIHHPRGTHQAVVEGISIAGKTGTAKKVVDGRYVDDRVVTSFVGFFPAENPQYVILVSLDEPRPSHEAYGATVAAPIFKEIVQWMQSHMLLTQ